MPQPPPKYPKCPNGALLGHFLFDLKSYINSYLICLWGIWGSKYYPLRTETFVFLVFSLIIKREVPGKNDPKCPKRRLRFYQTIRYGEKEKTPKVPHWGIWGLLGVFRGGIRIFSREISYTLWFCPIFPIFPILPIFPICAIANLLDLVLKAPALFSENGAHSI